MQTMSVRVSEKWLSLMPVPFSMMHFHLYKEFCHYSPGLCNCTKFFLPPNPSRSHCWKTNSQPCHFSSNELGQDKSNILPHLLLNDEIRNEQVFLSGRKGKLQSRGETAEQWGRSRDSLVLGWGKPSWGSHQHNSREKEEFKSCCVFLSLICVQPGSSTYSPGEIFFLVNKSHLKHCENRRYTAMLRKW